MGLMGRVVMKRAMKVMSDAVIGDQITIASPLPYNALILGQTASYIPQKESYTYFHYSESKSTIGKEQVAQKVLLLLTMTPSTGMNAESAFC